MFHTINLGHTGVGSIDIFRQNFVPEDEKFRCSSRHWLLDVSAGRDLLRVAARRTYPDARVTLFGSTDCQEHLMDEMIDRLKLRNLAEPRTGKDALVMEVVLTWLLFRVLLSGA